MGGEHGSASQERYVATTGLGRTTKPRSKHKKKDKNKTHKKKEVQIVVPGDEVNAAQQRLEKEVQIAEETKRRTEQAEQQAEQQAKEVKEAEFKGIEAAK